MSKKRWRDEAGRRMAAPLERELGLDRRYLS